MSLTDSQSMENRNSFLIASFNCHCLSISSSIAESGTSSTQLQYYYVYVCLYTYVSLLACVHVRSNVRTFECSRCTCVTVCVIPLKEVLLKPFQCLTLMERAKEVKIIIGSQRACTCMYVCIYSVVAEGKPSHMHTPD